MGGIVDETSELVRQALVVFGQEAAELQIQELLGVFLHDGSCKKKGGTGGLEAVLFLSTKSTFDLVD